MTTDELPPGWAWATVGTIVENFDGQRIPVKAEDRKARQGAYSYYGASGPIDTINEYLFDGEYLLIAEDGANLLSRSTPIAFRVSGQFWVNNHAHVVQLRGGMPLGYLEHFLNSINLQFHVTGTAQPKLNQLKLNGIRVPLPPLAEQHRIVERIEELFADLDAGVVSLERVRANLKRYRASVLKAAVEGRLTAEWRAAHPPAEPASALLTRILGDRRKRWEADQLAKFAAAGKTPPKDWQAKYDEPVTGDVKNLPPLPSGWCWASLGQCFKVAVGATPSRKVASYWGGEIPWVSSGQIQFNRIREPKEYITREGLAHTSTHLNPVGSVLLGMIGEGKTRGQTAVLDIAACNNQNCAAIWVSKTPIPPEFVYYWLWSRYDETRRTSSGNNQPALNASRVEAIPLPLPPLAEQEQIVAEVEARLSVVAAIEAQVTADLKRAARLRQAILKRAFAGQLVPQDPDDEPASTLLARICTTRVPLAATHPTKRGAVPPAEKPPR